jgi:hypothetical protein
MGSRKIHNITIIYVKWQIFCAIGIDGHVEAMLPAFEILVPWCGGDVNEAE